MERKAFWKSKTLWFNGVIVAALWAWQSGSSDLAADLDEALRSLGNTVDESIPVLVLVGIGIANLALRFVTKEAISIKDGKALWRSKTFLVNGALTAGLVADKFGYGDFTATLNSVGGADAKGVPPAAILVVLVVNLYLRLITKSSVRRLI